MSQSQRSASSASADVEATGSRGSTTSQMRGGQTGNVQADLTEQAREGARQAQEQVDKLVGMARGQATTQLATQKERAAGTLGSLATALREASRQMRQQDDTVTAGYVDTAAGQVDRLAGILADQDVDELLEATGQFARRQPALFLAAAFALGFAGARFLKSSSSNGGRTRFAGDRPYTGRTAAQSSSDYGLGTSDWQSRSGYDTGLEGQ